MACYRFLQYPKGETLIVDFDVPEDTINDGDNGTCLVDSRNTGRVGDYYKDYWIRRSRADCWEPCEDPRPPQRVNKMLRYIKDN